MINLIEAKESDRQFLAKVCLDAVQLYDSIIPGAFEKQAKKFLEEGLPKIYDIQIISSNDVNIGFVGQVNLDTSILYIPALYLLSSYQRKGYGKVIIEIIEKEACKNGLKSIVLLVHYKATWAINFYKNNGFEVIETDESNIKKYANGKMANYFLPATILMGKSLNGLNSKNSINV